MAVTDPVAPPAARPFVVTPGATPWPGLHEVLRHDYLRDESEVVASLIPLARPTPELRRQVRELAQTLVQAVRRTRGSYGGIDAFLQEYDLSSQEGILLMCIAEALLRIPDAETADKLIAEKLGAGNWAEHLHGDGSAFVNASTWGLMFTGRLLRSDAEVMRDPGALLRRLAGRVGEPVARQAMRQAMRIMGHEFVMGRNIDEALKRSRSRENAAYRYSFDMLGEAALTAEDAARYLQSYADAIETISRTRGPQHDEITAPSISVKLSALHPRYQLAQRERVLDELTPRLLGLAELARDGGIGLCVDAEEAERLELSLELFERLVCAASLRGWNGLGLAVQAYQKRALGVIGWLEELARANGRTVPVRLVKGAYWDTEVKRAQELGLAGYPVFTRKASTDLSYLACARRLLLHSPHLYPQFATHNAHTLASIYCVARSRSSAAEDDYEFQRLHGMGEELYAEVVGEEHLAVNCRVYAPVGSHADLLPYLVRRLLENGANTSFVNRIVDEHAPVDEIIAKPVDLIDRASTIAHPRIPLPVHLFEDRDNSPGVNLHDPARLEELRREMEGALGDGREATPLVGGKPFMQGTHVEPSRDPADERRCVGLVHMAGEQAVEAALSLAVRAQPAWDKVPAEERAGILERAADAFEHHRGELLALCVREGGRTIPDAISEWREAIDFLRYYAAQGRRDFGSPSVLPGPTGERNTLALQGRGVFVCISPWNFPLAIFTGQIAAALMAGNAVIAKPAEATSLTAARVVALFIEAGVPAEVLAFLPGEGGVIGAGLVADPRVDGVAFTGSTETAWAIGRALAGRRAPLATLIAETGGQNAMLVDSSALPEQVVLDVVQSAFNSAGQRCSALRVLFLQKEIAPHVLRLLEGYTQELQLGDPGLLSTDIGPTIDRAAQRQLLGHIDRLASSGRLLFRREPGESLAHGCFVGPAALRLESIAELEREVFGPVLHVVTYGSNQLDQVLESINGTGFGLTLGVHSRIDGVGEHIANSVRAGNVYINRNMVGAVVGVQPFGGRGLSGTGPKAGGPHYLHRFANERTVTVNTAAVGGNASLLSLNAD